MQRTTKFVLSAFGIVITGILFMLLGWFLIHTWVIAQPAPPQLESVSPPDFSAWLTGDGESGGMLSGDWGMSEFYRRNVAETINERVSASLELLHIGLVIVVVGGMSLGALLAFLRINYQADGVIRPALVLILSLPIIATGIYLVYEYGVQQGLFPLGGRCKVTLETECDPFLERLDYVMLPLYSLCIGFVGAFALWIRQAILRVCAMNDQYSATSNSFGLGIVWGVLYGLPFLYVSLASSLILVETIYVFPGWGRLLLNSLVQLDFTITGAIGFLFIANASVIYIGCRLLALLLMFISKHNEPEFIILPHALVGIPANRGNVAHAQSDSSSWVGLRVLRWLGLAFGLIVIGMTLVITVMYGNAEATTPNVQDRFLEPNEQYPLGTDDLGRDMVLRLNTGISVSMQLALTVGITATLIGSMFGLVLGIIPGTIGNYLNAVINQVLSLRNARYH